MAPNDENATFLQRMKDPRLRPLWRLTHTLIKVRNGALTHKDVKNEDRPGDVYEKKGRVTQWPRIKATLWPKMHGLRGNSGRNQRSADLFVASAVSAARTPPPPLLGRRQVPTFGKSGGSPTCCR
jgi:hypothetical protein